MNTWPFPPAGGPIPWTPKQIRDYANQQRQKQPDAPFFKSHS